MLLPVLAVLSALAAAAAGSGPARCAGAKDPKSLDALMACQDRAFAKASERYVKKKRGVPPPDVEERWRDAQREEVRAYLARHPDRAHVGPDDVPPAVDETPPAHAEQKDLDSLKARMWRDSDGGRRGITPEIAAQLTKYLKDRQGGQVSSEMQDLLDAVQKDGPKLTDGTVLKLKSAARQAKSEGMDLGVSPQVEDFLLHDEQAPEPPKNLN